MVMIPVIAVVATISMFFNVAVAAIADKMNPAISVSFNLVFELSILTMGYNQESESQSHRSRKGLSAHATLTNCCVYERLCSHHVDSKHH